jgi:hypothetical protein
VRRVRARSQSRALLLLSKASQVQCGLTDMMASLSFRGCGRGCMSRRARLTCPALRPACRSFNLVVNVVRSRAGNKNFFLVRAPTLAEWAKKVRAVC